VVLHAVVVLYTFLAIFCALGDILLSTIHWLVMSAYGDG